jgi:hypothetical protein
MPDIVELLRDIRRGQVLQDGSYLSVADLCREAADEIVRLRAVADGANVGAADWRHPEAANTETLRDVLVEGYRALEWARPDSAADDTIEAIEAALAVGALVGAGTAKAAE